MPKTVVELGGRWEFRKYPLSARRMRDLDSADWQPTDVPCSIFNSLISSGRIKQADIDTNPENFSWVSEEPWIYRKSFDAPVELLNCDRIDLVFDGLDTITSIWLNDKLIGRTNNMFIPFRFDVTGLLKPRDNLLLVKFEPATQYSKKLMDRYTPFSALAFRNPYRVYIRKAQYQFGWDWCPSLPGCGIWRPVRLEGIQKARFDEVHIRTVDCNQQYADVKISVKIETTAKENFLCRLILTGDGHKSEHNLTFGAGEDYQSTVMRIDKPSLWWPAGYGRQHLYKITLQLLNDSEIIDQIDRKIGIRTVRLNRSPDQYGEKFQFEINGQAVYAKGANWIPASMFAGSVTRRDYEELLNAAKECNMNMLRVWGGGYYEANEFYELCDQMGIMVWQDFMFACAYYPDRQWFLSQIKEEAAAIIKRLRNHACLTIWCGNNENDWLHSIGEFGKGKKFYGKVIYHQLLPSLVAEFDPDGNYIPSTPFGPAKNPNSRDCGTVHQWNVWAWHQPVHEYLYPAGDVPRFVPEFGFQALPDIGTIKRFCPPGQMRIGSRILEGHNYQIDGNSRLYRYIGDFFGSTGNLEQFVYLSQITQARAVDMHVRYLRARNFRNSGVLFWQINDCCPVISWSAIDYQKQPKALYYYAKRFFSDLLIVVVPEMKKVNVDLPPVPQSLSVIVINDSDRPVTATLECRLLDLYGHSLDRVALPIAIAPFTASTAIKLPKAIAFPANPESCCLHSALNRDGGKVAENLYFYLPDKYIDWPEAQISSRLSRAAENQWKLKLKASAIAKDVRISSSVPAQFSDNFLDLIPPDEYEITITSKEQATSLEAALQLHSLKLSEV